MQVLTVRSKMRRNRAAPQRCPDTRQRGMIRQAILQPVAGEPADRQVHLSLAHQSAVMHDPEKEPREHQPNRSLRIDPRAADIHRINIRDLLAQPAEFENAIDAGEDLVIRNKIPERAADEELELPALLRTKHSFPPVELRLAQQNQEVRTFSTAPSSTCCGTASTSSPTRTAGRWRPR